MATMQKNLTMATMEEESSFSAMYRKGKAKKLQDVWPTIEWALHDYGIDCELNLAQGCMTISKTTMTKGQNCFEKAKRLIENLATTNVPPLLAVRFFKGDRSHICIKIGNQEGGLSAEAELKKEVFLERWECLAASLGAITTRWGCSLFLSEDNIVVVAGGAVMLAVKKIVRFCILFGLHPYKYLNSPTDRLYHYDELLKQHVEYAEPTPLLDIHGLPEVTSICMVFVANQEKEVQKAWPFVHSFFDDYGVSCKLNMVRRTMTISTTRRANDLDIMDNAGDFLELLGRTRILATKAVELLNGQLHYEVIRNCFGNGGLCTKYDIENWVENYENLMRSSENWSQNYKRFMRNSQAIGRLLKCEIYIRGVFVVAVGASAEGVSLFRSIMECCFIKNEDPLRVGRRLKLDRKTYRLLKKLARLRL